MSNEVGQGGIDKGFLIIGLTNTLLFNGDSAYEAILLNLANGEDFSMPVTQEQAASLADAASSSLKDSDEDQKTIVRPNAFSGSKEAPQL